MFACHYRELNFSSLVLFETTWVKEEFDDGIMDYNNCRLEKSERREGKCKIELG